MANVTLTADLDAFIQSTDDADAEAELLGTPKYFTAHKTASQGSIPDNVETAVTWVEVLDPAGVFAANEVTPGNGEVWQLNTTVCFLGNSQVFRLAFTKNGTTIIRISDSYPTGGTVFCASGSHVVVGNGTDTYGVSVTIDTGGSDGGIYEGGEHINSFSGVRIR